MARLHLRNKRVRLAQVATSVLTNKTQVQVESVVGTTVGHVHEPLIIARY